jgi:excisionase family DNA binding protein
MAPLDLFIRQRGLGSMIANKQVEAIAITDSEQESPWNLRVSESARLTGVSPDAIYQAIYRGTLRARKFRSRGWLIARKDLEEWIENETTPNVA